MLGKVVDESGDDIRIAEVEVPEISASLTAAGNIRALQSLAANAGLCFQGVVPAGGGFRLEPERLESLGVDAGKLPTTVRPYIIGRDIVQRVQDKYIIDFFGRDEKAAREQWPSLYQVVFDEVLPERRHNKRDSYKSKWWIFAEPRPAMRTALSGLGRFIVTPYTSKFRPFVFVDGNTIPDAMAYAIASSDSYVLGILSSSVHCLWAMRAGGRLGVGNDSRYTSNTTFLPFPFPVSNAEQTRAIRSTAEAIDQHRKQRQLQHPELTVTAMYNALELVRSGEAMSAKDRILHEQGLISLLKRLHDELDAAVFSAYGWSQGLSDEQILERLVALNCERSEEEKRGLVRWIRPEFQAPQKRQQGSLAIEPTDAAEEGPKATTPTASRGTPPWPKKLSLQIGAVRDVVSSGTRWTLGDMAAQFKGANVGEVEEVLESLAALGVVVLADLDGTPAWVSLSALRSGA